MTTLQGKFKMNFLQLETRGAYTVDYIYLYTLTSYKLPHSKTTG